MAKPDVTITVIGLEERDADGSRPAGLPREGATPSEMEQHGKLSAWVGNRVHKTTEMSVDRITKSIDGILPKITTIAERFAKQKLLNLEMDEVTIGLALSGEGDVGIVKAGVETSIEVTFKVKRGQEK